MIEGLLLNIRRTLATAVAAAVTAPVFLLSATPALAVPRSAGATPATAADASALAATSASASASADPGAAQRTVRDRDAAGLPAPDARQSPKAADDRKSATAGGDRKSAKTQKGKPSIEDLERALAAAEQAYRDAKAAEDAALAELKRISAPDSPLVLALAEAKRLAKDAAAARTAADTALAEAEAALDALPEDATEEQKTAAEQTVADAATVAEAATEKDEKAAAKATAAHDDLADAQVEASKVVHRAELATAKALKAKEAAGKALEEALAEAGDDSCTPAPRLTVDAKGVPGAIARGATAEFTVRVTNGTRETLDTVLPYVAVRAVDESGQQGASGSLRLTWSGAGSPAWQKPDADHRTGVVKGLKPGEHADIKVRLAVDAAAPLGVGTLSVTADYRNDDGSCGYTPYYYEYGFALTAQESPAPAPSATPAPTTPAPAPSPAGGALSPVTVSPTSVATAPAGGSLAATGSSSAVPAIALAGGAALVAGAGAVYAVRRRRPVTED
ncbi:LPXTG cell wall anchor domain-containing protein [Streptomyces sp. ODS05-4]|uniref:LPXTG cell wall anchor domain-containing protein n=1 Tax=Streptomyces sp. ODS05-4 TaxID=2944939 RepID=UPI00210D5C15|nr:LPXTG cell wall anchor domain-containing protein [Streptomyces sp. ODS05-4]